MDPAADPDSYPDTMYHDHFRDDGTEIFKNTSERNTKAVTKKRTASNSLCIAVVETAFGRVIPL